MDDDLVTREIKFQAAFTGRLSTLRDLTLHGNQFRVEKDATYLFQLNERNGDCELTKVADPQPIQIQRDGQVVRDQSF